MNLKRRKPVFEDAIFERVLEKKGHNTRTASEEKYVEDEDALSAELLEVEKKILQHLRKSIERSSAAEFKSTVDGDSGAEKASPCSQWEMDKELEKTMLEANEYTAEATIARLNVLTEVYEKTAQVSCPSLFSP